MRSLQRLDGGAVRETVGRLAERIEERFPGRGLCGVADELAVQVERVCADALETGGRLRHARTVSRVLMAVVVLAALTAFGLAVRTALTDDVVEHGLDWLPLLESGINDLVFAAIAVFFLYSFPERLQRGHTLALLHQLRSLAHIIDMHQLTKDPEQLRPSFRSTSASRPPDLDRDEMERYLDYCSEMLSLVGKAAALCAEESRDAVVLDTVNSIEQLTTGLSRKIWQKISTLPPPGSAEPVQDA